jgi:hypothetical protein
MTAWDGARLGTGLASEALATDERAAIAAALQARREEVVEVALARLVADPVRRNLVSPARRARLRTALAALVDEATTASSFSRAGGAVRLLQEAVANGGDRLGDLLACCRAAHAALSLVLDDAVVGSGADGERLRALGRRFLFDCAERWAAAAEREYENRHHRRASPDAEKLGAVRETLAGRQAGSLKYPLQGSHIALVASGPDVEALELPEASRGHGTLLSVSPEPNWRWSWIAVERGGVAALLGVLRRLTVPPEVHVAFGGPDTGRRGFRTAHERASAAHWAATVRGEALLFHSDVALELLALANEPAAREFAARELAPLAIEGERGLVLRATLHAYFRAGHNAASAAAVLGVHERTVTNRLRALEQRLGAPVTSRRAELETALRIAELLPAQSPSALVAESASPLPAYVMDSHARAPEHS